MNPTYTAVRLFREQDRSLTPSHLRHIVLCHIKHGDAFIPDAKAQKN